MPVRLMETASLPMWKRSPPSSRGHKVIQTVLLQGLSSYQAVLYLLVLNQYTHSSEGLEALTLSEVLEYPSIRTPPRASKRSR